MAVHGKAGAVMLAVVTIILLAFPCIYSTAKAQSGDLTTFSTHDTYDTPEYNSTIRFAVNGSYSAVALSNGVWMFTNLRLNNSQSAGNISIGAKDSEIVIQSMRASNFTGRSSFLRYTALGAGTQTVDLDPGSNRQTHWSEWSVTVPGESGTVWLSEGKNWDLQPDNTVVVMGITGNVSVVHYIFNDFSVESNSPLHEQHSILLLTTVALAVIVGVALVVKINMRRD